MTETEQAWLMYGTMWVLILALLYFRHLILDEQEIKNQDMEKDSPS